MASSLDLRSQCAVLGAFTADAASLGLHWLYDVELLRKAVERRGRCEFLDPEEEDYGEDGGYFAHGMRRAGDLSHYGESGLVMLRVLAEDGEFSRPRYEEAFRKHFGPGGEFHGYIDNATRVTLEHLAARERLAEASRPFPEEPCGADDNQVSATAKLAPLVAVYAEQPELDQVVESAVRATNHNDEAVAWSVVSARMIEAAMLGLGVDGALAAGRDAASPVCREVIDAACAQPGDSPVEVIGKLGRSCPTPYALPVIFYLLRHWRGYAEAVRMNILGGGDSCGRAMILGAILGAAHGMGNDSGIPFSWMLQVPRNREAASLLEKIQARG